MVPQLMTLENLGFVSSSLTPVAALRCPYPGADVHKYATAASLSKYTVGVRSTTCSVSCAVDAVRSPERPVSAKRPSMLAENEKGARWCGMVTGSVALLPATVPGYATNAAAPPVLTVTRA